MNEEKVRELAIRISADRNKLSIHGIERHIQELLEQNQPDPVVVGLSDEQILLLAKDLSNGKNILLYCAIRDWCAKQTFAKPDTPAVDIAAYDRRINELVAENEQLKSQSPPSWDNVPEGSNWLAQDEDGRWSHYAGKPIPHKNEYDNKGFGYWESYRGDKTLCVEKIDTWQQTLQQRPESHRKPEIITVNGFEVEDGDRGLPWGNQHYMPSVTARDFYTFDVPNSQEMVCKYGMAYRTREGAIARAKAMIGIDPNTGETK